MSRAGLRPASAASPRRSRRWAGFCVESLESRRLLSTISTLPTITPASASVTADRGGWGEGRFSGGLTNPSPASSALSPSQVANLYSMAQSSSTADGQTIAIVDAYNDPNIQSDLAAFDAQYNLPAASLTVLNQAGQKSSLPATDPGWSLEIALDVEWAHAAAPGAKIVLVEANSASVGDLMTAVQTAAKSASVVSMSWGGSEFSGETAYDSVFATPGVTFVAASGDSGGSGGAQWPAVSPNVVGVGGTTLLSGLTETAWSASGSSWSGYSGSGGGGSAYEPVPAYQSAVLGAWAKQRSTPDVASLANPNSGLSVYNTVPGSGQTGWFQVGGTSAGAPLWAGVIAAADQARGKALGSSQTLSMLYSLAGNTSTYASTFHDVTTGSNLAGSATRGYDPVTGLGSPIVSAIVSAASSLKTSTVASRSAPLLTAGPAAINSTISAQDVVLVPVVVSGKIVLVAVFLPLTPPIVSPATAHSAASSAAVDTPALSSSSLARPVQPLNTSGLGGRLSLSDDTREATKSDWRREPNLYIEPLDAPTSPFDPLDLLASELASDPMTQWAGTGVAVSPGLTDLTESSPGNTVEIPREPTPVETPEADRGILAGAALAAWGLWEFRSRRSDRDARRSLALLGHPPR